MDNPSKVPTRGGKTYKMNKLYTGWNNHGLIGWATQWMNIVLNIPSRSHFFHIRMVVILLYYFLFTLITWLLHKVVDKIGRLHNYLEKEYEMKDLENMKFFLVIEVSESK